MHGTESQSSQVPQSSPREPVSSSCAWGGGGGEEGQWLKTVPTVVQSKSVALLILIGYLYTHAPSAMWNYMQSI